MRKRCPKCDKVYGEIQNYCAMCGIELERDANHCSEGRTAICAKAVCGENDIYCTYCGALTAYAKERQPIPLKE